MFESFKISLVIFSLYFPLFFLVLIPSNSIFLKPQDLHDEICTKLSLPFVCEAPSVTLAVIKPDGMPHINDIMTILAENRFRVLDDMTVNLSTNQIRTWYADKLQEPYYPALEAYLQRGAVRVLSLSRHKAVPKLRQLIGPTDSNKARKISPKSIRARYGTNVQENVIHASDTSEAVAREHNIIFSKE